MPTEVKEIIEELEKAVEPNDFGQGVVFAIQTIKDKYGIDDYEWEQDDERQNIPSVLFKDCDYITGKATDNVTYDECIYCYRYDICKKCYIEKHLNEEKP